MEVKVVHRWDGEVVQMGSKICTDGKQKAYRWEAKVVQRWDGEVVQMES